MIVVIGDNIETDENVMYIKRTNSQYYLPRADKYILNTDNEELASVFLEIIKQAGGDNVEILTPGMEWVLEEYQVWKDHRDAEREAVLSNWRLESLDKNLLVMLSADWCGPCKVIKPKMQELEKEGKFHLKIVDADEFGRDLKIKTVPYAFYFEFGELVKEGHPYEITRS